jgi:hypothetical protein
LNGAAIFFAVAKVSLPVSLLIIAGAHLFGALPGASADPKFNAIGGTFMRELFNLSQMSVKTCLTVDRCRAY